MPNDVSDQLAMPVLLSRTPLSMSEFSSLPAKAAAMFAFAG